MTAPTPDQVSAYARAVDAAGSAVARLIDLLRGPPEVRASRKRRAALRKLARAGKIEARRPGRAATLRAEARDLIAEAEALWPLASELAALGPVGAA